MIIETNILNTEIIKTFNLIEENIEGARCDIGELNPDKFRKLIEVITNNLFIEEIVDKNLTHLYESEENLEMFIENTQIYLEIYLLSMFHDIKDFFNIDAFMNFSLRSYKEDLALLNQELEEETIIREVLENLHNNFINENEDAEKYKTLYLNRDKNNRLIITDDEQNVLSFLNIPDYSTGHLMIMVELEINMEIQELDLKSKLKRLKETILIANTTELNVDSLLIREDTETLIILEEFVDAINSVLIDFELTLVSNL